MNKLITLTLALTASSICAVAQTSLPAPVATKLKVPALSANAGTSVAINETYILAGSPSSPVNGLTSAGDVLVFRVSDGAFVRRLVSFAPKVDGNFGRGLALYGNIAYIGAKGEAPSPAIADSGAVHAFDLTTGKQLWIHVGRSGQKLGQCISVSGDLMAVGGPTGELAGKPADSGSVCIIERKSGTEVQSYSMPSAVASDWFGYSVALNGRLLAVGAPLRSAGALSDAGQVLIMDAISGQIINTVSQGNPQAGAQFGASLAHCKNYLVVGAPEWDNGGSTAAGFVAVLNSDGTNSTTGYLSDVKTHKRFGISIAAAGNMVLVGGQNVALGGEAFLFDIKGNVDDAVEVATHASTDALNFGCAVAMTEQALIIGDSLQPIVGSSNKGALWLAKSLQQRLDPSYRYGMTNDLAPGGNGARYASFSESTLLENNSVIMFRATLKGTGVTTANDSAVFNDWSTTLPDLILRKGSKVGTKTVTALGRMFFTPTSWAWPIIQTTTGGVNGVFRDDGTNVNLDILGNTPVNPGNAAIISSIKALTCAVSEEGTATFVYTGKLGAGVTTGNDSRIASYERNIGMHQDAVAEGNLSPVSGRNYGQISPRIAAGVTHFAFCTALSGTTTENLAVCLRKPGIPTTLIAQKGKPAPGATGNFATFLGEGVNANGSIILRATTSTGLEGLWTKTTAGSLTKVIVKGDIAPGAPTGVKFSRVTRFFIADNQDVLFTAIVSGTGVTTANDQGVWLQHSGVLSLLMREGDAAPGCDGARVASISAVDFGTKSARYSILTTLTGSTATNQGLFYGNANNTSQWARQPMLNLRKGSYIDKTGGQRITSLAIGTQNIAPGGSGSNGNVRLVSDEGALVKVTYSDLVQELMCLRP